MGTINLLFLLSTIIGLIGVSINAQLSPHFYKESCPDAVVLVERYMHGLSALDPRLGPSLLRLHYSDCVVNGCDASVLLDDTANFTGEKTVAPNNISLQGFEAVDLIKSRLEVDCVAVVSCADILAIAAQKWVRMVGGPGWTVRLGRRDSTTASLSDANGQIPSHGSNLDTFNASLAAKGFSPGELVVLSGVRGLINNFTFIDSDYAAGKLYNNGSADSFVREYRQNGTLFEEDFAAAMVKMSELSPLTGAAGQIRKNCRSVN